MNAGKKPSTVARARILDDDLSFLLAAVTKENPDADVVQVRVLTYLGRHHMESVRACMTG